MSAPVYIPAPELREIARELQAAPTTGWRLWHIDLDRIEFVREVTCRPTRDAGQCIVVQPPVRAVLQARGADCSHVIVVYGYHAEGKSRNWLKALVYHELRHIGYDGRLIDHGVEDWPDVLAVCGVNWREAKDVPDVTGAGNARKP